MAANRDSSSDEEFSDDGLNGHEMEYDGAAKAGDGDERKKPVKLREKDEEEEELERLVFGDTERFRQQLRLGDFLSTGQDADSKALQLVGAGADDGDGLAHLDDADLFALDTAPATSTELAHVSQTLGATAADGPAWEDSDDERLTVSLASVNRLRKLRVTENEDVVNGAEYTKRLRQQFLRLNPMPAWAVESAARPAKRRQRSLGAGSASSGSDAESDGEDETGDISTQPLAEFLRDSAALNASSGSSKKRRLRPGTLDIQRSRDLPNKHQAGVTSLSFHPTQPILLSSSPAGLLRLHRIDPTAHPIPNPEIVSVQPQRIDVRRSQFVGADGNKIVFAGRRGNIFGWNLDTGLVQCTSKIQGHKNEHKTMERFRASPCGRWLAIQASSRKGGGNIDIVNLVTMQWIATARLDSRHGIIDYAWWRDGEGLTILGKDGKVGEWCLERTEFLAIWHDEGSIGGTVVALGGKGGPEAAGGDRWVAVGSSSGIVNLYDRQVLFIPTTSASVTSTDTNTVTTKPRPEPTKTFENLITPITCLAFSPDGQMLAFASRLTKDGLKLVHLPSCAVYQNWPTAQTPLGRISSMAFAKHEFVLAVGNDTGKVRLWDIRA